MKDDPSTLTRLYFDRQLLLMTSQYVLQGASATRWQQAVSMEGVKGLREAVAEGNGLVLGALHFGCTLLSLQYLEVQGMKVNVIRPEYMRNIKSARQRRMLYIHRNVIYVGGDAGGLASPVRDAVKELKKGNIIGIAFDGDQGGNTTPVPVLGGHMPLRLGGLEIARMARAPMVFALCVYENGKLRFRFSPVIRFSEDESSEDTTRRFLQSSIEAFEQYVRKYPECVWWTKPFSELFGIKSSGKNDEE
jgi:lauroyl/myristoyl acyltransferase